MNHEEKGIKIMCNRADEYIYFISKGQYFKAQALPTRAEKNQIHVFFDTGHYAYINTSDIVPQAIADKLLTFHASYKNPKSSRLHHRIFFEFSEQSALSKIPKTLYTFGIVGNCAAICSSQCRLSATRLPGQDS